MPKNSLTFIIGLQKQNRFGWSGGWKIWQAAKRRPECRAALLRMMAVSLLFILLGEYALSGYY
ncbi:hypothetical protein [Xenorhabdus sp. IM139775]|uniref:hypothetical protein n=1 Tax=Xenorhabdus sp. IM139775 TaxID=3025876 RepID=UPI002358BCDB|nr:hypothetical protein [Xenorhabdus sp. IM139775]MDC9595097.1 hypothetical protein [Xenorhabdus sp. IM139775]